MKFNETDMNKNYALKNEPQCSRFIKCPQNPKPRPSCIRWNN